MASKVVSYVSRMHVYAMHHISRAGRKSEEATSDFFTVRDAKMFLYKVENVLCGLCITENTWNKFELYQPKCQINVKAHTCWSASLALTSIEHTIVRYSVNIIVYAIDMQSTWVEVGRFLYTNECLHTRYRQLTVPGGVIVTPISGILSATNRTQMKSCRCLTNAEPNLRLRSSNLKELTCYNSV